MLHVTEASSAGVLHAAGGLARRQAELGAHVEFAYIRRPDSPPRSDIDALLHPATGVEFGASDDGMLNRLRSLRAYLSGAASDGGFDVIHAHSSLAGAALRIGLRLSGYSGLVAYSPHGFAFLRLDVPWFVRRGFRLAERLGARKGVLFAASESEEALAREVLHPAAAAVIANGVEELPVSRTPDVDGRPTVGIVGRITYQKAPWRFAAVARALADRADFVWIGDGPESDAQRWVGDAPVTITGWLSPEQVRERVSRLSVFCFPTLWEGMPLSLLEAQAAGVPAVASRIVGNQDIVIDGRTGYLTDEEGDLIRAVERLLDDPQLRRRMGSEAAESVARRFDARESAKESLKAYRRALLR